MAKKSMQECLPAQLVPTRVEAGCDEAGRGCLCGPVVAAAVILPPGYTHPLLVDSKKLSEKQRLEARALIERDAVAWAVGQCSPAEIDTINILNASIEAMHRAVRSLAVRPGFLAVDGNRFKPCDDIAHETVVKGDARYAHIAAASIMAKTTRDAIMTELAREYPQYGWSANKGYPTADHRTAIARYGACPQHRMSFTLLPGQPPKTKPKTAKPCHKTK